MALLLRVNELASQNLHIRRECHYARSVLTLCSGMPVFERTVGTAPSQLAADMRGRTGQRSSTTKGESMEQSVVGGADCAA